MNEKLELPIGIEVNLNVPFSYVIGDENPVTGKTLRTIEDCKEAVKDELMNMNLLDPLIIVGDIEVFDPIIE